MQLYIYFYVIVNVKYGSVKLTELMTSLSFDHSNELSQDGRCYSVIAGQTMVWAIFHLLPINLKFQWAIFFKFNIAISVVNGPFFC